MERQSTSKLYRALIAVVAFFVLCTSAILFASCGTNPLECEHTYGPGDVKEVRLATCGENGTVTYECSKCGALVTLTGTLATGDHKFVNGRCEKCGATSTEGELTLADLKADLTSILTALNTVAGKADVDKVASSVVAALKNPDTTIPNLWKLLTDIRDNISELDFDIDLVADGEPTTLKEVITSLYKQVNKLYLDLTDEGKNTDGLYDLLVGVGGTGTEAHVHNWVLELKPGTEYSCTTPNTYVWGCSFCDATKGDDVTVMATGHATEFKTGVNVEGHYYAATCISPARVEGYCANCEQYTGEWTTQGQPTYQHHYVLETGTDVDGNEGTAGSCTSVHQYVYHCETCGGAYVEEVKGSTQHNYYYTLNEDGTKRPMTDEEKIQVWNDAHPDDEIDSLDELTYAEEQELNELLKEDHLNIVYYSEPNCVDPALIVVECMECGVRYAYTFGQPDGHHFIRVHETVNATCTMDGVEQYFYCDHCGYFFFLDGITDDDLNDDDVVVTNIGSKAYTRNYMTDLDDNVINDKTDKALENQDAYDRASKEKDALGHDYVVVYTNTEKCVTAQDYILVCQREGCLVEGKEFDDLVQVGEEAVKEDALFYRETATSPLFLKGLTGNNTADAAILTSFLTKKTADAATSDLTKEWTALASAEDSAIATWLESHKYLVRDAKDDESATTLKALTGTALKALYHGENVISGFELPVKGHTFNDYYVTVIGNCVMYERHVYFCAVCGQGVGTPSEGDKAPYVVSGDTDQYIARIADTAKTDLDLAWEAICAAAEADPSNEQYILLEWLFTHGYLNDYRVRLTEDDVTDPADRLNAELNLVGERLGTLLGAGFTTDWLKSKFTRKNVLDEYKVDMLFGQTDQMEDPDDPYFILNDNAIVLGHTFDRVTLLSAEACDAPGAYIYICSKCGKGTAAESDLIYQSGENQVRTGLKQYAQTGREFKSDNDAKTASAAASRLGTGEGQIAKTDLELEWENQTTEQDKFDWLLEKGYLNNIIDTYYTDGYKIGEETLGGKLAELLKAAKEAAPDELVYVDTDMYREARATMYGTDGKLLELDADVKEDLLAIAKDLAKVAGHTVTDSTDGDISVYFTMSGDTEVEGLAANKTIDFAKTQIPVAGHLYARENGTIINVVTDPLCVGFGSKELYNHYVKHEMVYWDDTLGADGKPNGWTVCGTFDPKDLDPAFVAQVNANTYVKGGVQYYGILGACARQNCPYHTKYEGNEEGGEWKGTEKFTGGYYAVIDHQYSYEKLTKGENGYPTTTVESEKVYYNNNDWADYLPEGVVATAEEVVDGTTLATDAQVTAAKAAMDADLTNLQTLQKYWNALFISEDWLNPKDAVGNVDTALANSRKTKYPTITFGEDVLTSGKLDLGKLADKFDTFEVDGETVQIPYLWSGTLEDLVSEWRPVNDYGEPSCWVSQRCHWYHYTNEDKGFDGKTCNGIYPPNRHDFPKEGDFGFDTHVANCQHIDLCDCCGSPEGTPGYHNLLVVSPVATENQIESDTLKAAWLEVLRHYEEIEWLKDIVWVDVANLSVENWSTCWKVLADSCFEAETVHTGGDRTENEVTHEKEDGHVIRICSGELEVIYKEIVKGGAEWNTVVCTDEESHTEDDGLLHWTSNPEDLGKEANERSNYMVETVDKKNAHTYETMYYLGGVEYTEKEWNGYTDDEGKWHAGARFSATLCHEGYYTLEVCVNLGRDGVTRCSHVKGDKKVYPADDEHKGHALAPILEYWTYPESYNEKDASHNARMLQVCVICGATFTEEYGATTSGEGSTRNQYHCAELAEINEWNEFVEMWNAQEENSENQKWKAQMVRTDDIATPGEGGDIEEGTTIFGNGLNVYSNDATFTVKGDSDIGEMGGNATVLVAEGKTLTFATDSAARNISLHGTVTFVGEGKGASVDFSDLDGFLKAANNVNLVFENMDVTLNDAETSGDTRIAVNARNNMFTFKNSTVRCATTPFAFNAHSVLTNSKIVIEDSVFISDGEGIAIWNGYLTIEAVRSVFFGANAGAFIRGGNATFEDCEFYTKASTHGTLGDGSDTDVSAAIVIGDKTDSWAKREVVLHGCKFGTTTADNMEKWGTDEFATGVVACTSTDPAIAAFSSAKKTTLVTLDGTTTANANVINKNDGVEVTDAEGNPTLTFNTVLTAEEAADTEVLEGLFTSLGTNGGELTLPAELAAPVTLEGQFNVAKDLTLDLNGNELDAKAGIVIATGATLTLKGGEIKGAPSTEEYKNQLFTVSGGALDLEGVTVTLTGADSLSEDKTAWNSTYGIFAGGDSKVTVANSVIDNPYGPAIGTNARTTTAEIVLTDSAFISNFTETKDNATSIALLLNNKDSKLYAGGCYFYGVNAAAWLRGGEAHFYGCTFASPATVRSYNNGFSSGAGFHKDVTAVLVVGNGDNADYGAVNVEIVDCNVKAASAPANDTLPTVPAQVATTALSTEEVESLADKYGKNYDKTWHGTHATTTVATAKAMTLLAFDSQTTTVTFSDENTAKVFLPDLTLTLNTNVFKYGTASGSNFVLNYKDAQGTLVAINGIE